MKGVHLLPVPCWNHDRGLSFAEIITQPAVDPLARGLRLRRPNGDIYREAERAVSFNRAHHRQLQEGGNRVGRLFGQHGLVEKIRSVVAREADPGESGASGTSGRS